MQHYIVNIFDAIRSMPICCIVTALEDSTGTVLQLHVY